MIPPEVLAPTHFPSPINPSESHILSTPKLTLVILKMKVPHMTLLMWVMLALFSAETQVSMAVTCNALQLSACASAITSSTPPTSLCCTKLKEQRPCLCGYLKDPNLQKLVNSPNARKVADACASPFPTC